MSPIPMRRVGRDQEMALQVTQEGFFPHHAQHPLVVDLPACMVQRLRHAPVAIAWKLQHELLNRLAQGDILFPVFCRSPGIVPTATDAEPGTQLSDRDLWIHLLHHPDHLLPFLDAVACSA